MYICRCCHLVLSRHFEEKYDNTVYDTRSLSPRKCSANILRTSSFQCIFISESTVAPTPLFLHLIRLLKPFSKSILQCKIKWEMGKMWQCRYERISDCNLDHPRGKNRICIENKKTKNLKTSLDPKLNFLSSDVLQNAKFLVLWPTRFFPRRD